MLPGDITGVSIYNQKIGDFEFRPGPIMAQIVLADEINGDPQGAIGVLECMEEGQISVDGATYKYRLLSTFWQRRTDPSMKAHSLCGNNWKIIMRVISAIQ